MLPELSNTERLAHPVQDWSQSDLSALLHSAAKQISHSATGLQTGMFREAGAEGAQVGSGQDHTVAAFLIVCACVGFHAQCSA